MTYQEASTEQLLLWLKQARNDLYYADYAERDWARYVNDAQARIGACSVELKARGIPHDTHKLAQGAED